MNIYRDDLQEELAKWRTLALASLAVGMLLGALLLARTLWTPAAAERTVTYRIELAR
jgi:hypothetical protein